MGVLSLQEFHFTIGKADEGKTNVYPQYPRKIHYLIFFRLSFKKP